MWTSRYQRSYSSSASGSTGSDSTTMIPLAKTATPSVGAPRFPVVTRK